MSGGQSNHQEDLKLRFQWRKKKTLWIVEVEVRNQFKGQKQEQDLRGQEQDTDWYV